MLDGKQCSRSLISVILCLPWTARCASSQAMIPGGLPRAMTTHSGVWFGPASLRPAMAAESVGFGFGLCCRQVMASMRCFCRQFMTRIRCLWMASWRVPWESFHRIPEPSGRCRHPSTWARVLRVG